MNSKEISNGSKECVEIDKETNQVIIRQAGDTKENGRTFTYDAVYGAEST